MRRGTSPRRVFGALVLATALGLAGPVAEAAAQATPQVVGGTATPIASAPFTVALTYAGIDPYDGLNCGGVIVDATHVVTAAHCVDDLGSVDPPGSLVVLAGSATLPLINTVPPGAISDPVIQTSFDPNYDPGTGDNDVGIVTLQEPLWSGSTPPLDGTSTIAPLPLAQSASDEAPGLPATVSGWGYDSPITLSGDPVQPLPKQLQSASLSLISDADCTTDLGGTGLDPLQPSQLCAGTLTNTDASACYGDSGGPLYDAPNGAMPADDVLVGLVDLSYGCAEGFPGVYTNVMSPEVQRFLQSNPPQAPYSLSDATIDSAGLAVTCDPGGWAGDPTLEYQFFADPGLTSPPVTLTGVQASPLYTAPSAGGDPIYCGVTATNAGGYNSAFSDDEVTPASVPPPVTLNTSPPPPAATTSSTTTSTSSTHTAPPVLPRLHVLSRSCAHRRCTVVVAGLDTGGPGVQTVGASLHELARVSCRIHGKRSTCTRSIHKGTAVTNLSGGRFEITASGLPVGSYSLALVAVDRAGGLQTHATTLALRVAR